MLSFLPVEGGIVRFSDSVGKRKVTDFGVQL
jgi:hypothetical protein